MANIDDICPVDAGQRRAMGISTVERLLEHGAARSGRDEIQEKADARRDGR